MAREPNFSINFNNNSDCLEFLGDGWWDLEKTHVWAKGTRSTLMLPPLRKAPTAIELVVGAFVHAEIRPVQRVVISCNGIQIGSFKTVNGKFPLLVCSLASDLFDETGPNIIDIYHPDHIIPNEVGAPDWRDLSICLYAMKLRPAVDADKREVAVNIFSEMESLGDSCVFGLVQRLAGIEPLGLFRFAGIKLPDMVRLLDARFAQIARPENIRIEVKTADKELYVFDDLYNFNYHLFRDDTDLDVVLEKKKQISRIRFLARKLEEDLSNGDKLFVWCSFDEGAEQDVLELVEKIRSFGPGTLLWVCGANAGKLSGQVEYVTKNLIRGYVSRIASYPPHMSNVPFDEWKTMVNAAHQLWKNPR